MGEFCSRCGKTLSVIDPLLDLRGLRYCEDCYPDAKREQAASSMNEKLDRKHRVSFGEDDSDDTIRGQIIKGKQALATREAEFKWDNPSLSVIASALRILNDQNKVLMRQNELILRELERMTSTTPQARTK